MRKTKIKYYVMVPFDNGGEESGVEHWSYESRGGSFTSLKAAQKEADEWNEALVIKVISGEIH